MNNEWKEYKLGEVAEVVGGGTPDTTNLDYWNGDIYWLTPRDLAGYTNVYISKGERNISEKGLKNSSAKLLPKGTILLTSRAPIGYIAIANNIVCTNQGFKSLIPNDKILYNIFLYYWLKNNVTYLQSIGTGSTFSEISGSVVKEINILLPSLSTQQKIADILSSLDDKIALLNRQNATLESMAEALFRHHFIDNAKEDWKEGKLTDIASFLNGLACQKFPPKDNINKLPILKIRELSSGISDDSDWATTDISKEYFVENGDIIFAWSASLMIKIWNGSKCILNQHLFKVTSNEYPQWFFLMWSKYHLAEFKAIAASHATTMGHIKRSDLDSATVLIPTIDELMQMTQQFQPIINKQIANNKQIHTLTHLRDTLLPKLMNGEVKV